MLRLLRLLRLSAILLLAALPRMAAAQLSAQLSSYHLARGERAFLNIVLPGRPTPEMAAAIPVLPQVPGVEFRFNGSGVSYRRNASGTADYLFQLVLRSDVLGRHTIPPVTLSMPSGGALRTNPVEFVVFDPATIKWSEVTVAQSRARYSIAFHLLDERPYPGQAVPVEIKLYLSVESSVRIVDWGVPEFQTDGITCWRFEPDGTIGNLAYNGDMFAAVAYNSVLSPTREGTVSIGPAKVRLTSAAMARDVTGMPTQVTDNAFLDVARLEFATTPLPPGAPAGFDGAIGSFSISSATPQTEVREGDPIAVDLTVSGTGNLDNLQAPRVQNSTGWKIYETGSRQRGDERRQASGSVAFQQLIKPLAGQTSVPPFEFSFFDPRTARYQTLLTRPIPLKVLPSHNRAAVPVPNPVPPALPMPVEKMSDILGILQPSSLVKPAASVIPRWTGHAIAALLALALIARAIQLRVAARRVRRPDHSEERRALAELAKIPDADSSAFLRQAGAFIERWLGPVAADEEYQAILHERDLNCYRPTPGHSDLGKRRSEILATLRKALRGLPLLACALVLPATAPTARAATAPPAASLKATAQADYEAADYESAIRLWLSAGPYDTLAPDTLYNIGDACYRLGSPGYAALYFHRALLANPSHAEALQNLRFIERKCGSITIHRPDYQETLALIPLSVWRGAAWTGAWLILLGCLVFPATRPGARLRYAGLAAMLVAPILAAAGLLGSYYFPDDAAFAPASRQAVVIADKATVRTDAARTSPEVIEAPAGSLCEILRSSGSWVYVALASQTRGWLPADAIQPLIPRTPPAPPAIRKPEATGNSA